MNNKVGDLELGVNTSKRERILDAAEALFATHGYDGVTIRQIAHAAQVDVALASYHYGKKRDLFDAVFFRRAEVLNQLRLDQLTQCEDAAGEEGPSVESIIEAFIRPLNPAALEAQTGDTGWHNYMALVAYINNSPVWGKQMMTKHYDPLVDRFIAALKKALPSASEEEIYWGYNYFSGALSLTFARTGRIDQLSHGAVSSDNIEKAYATMVPFIAAGFKQFREKNQ
ncbi:MAG: TetR family transcriptional regulator [Agarilytica sp.]